MKQSGSSLPFALHLPKPGRVGAADLQRFAALLQVHELLSASLMYRMIFLSKFTQDTHELLETTD